MKARTLAGQQISFGFLLWWTIAQAIYEREPLINSAVNLPDEIKNALTGAKEKNAWERATSLKIGSLPAIEDREKSVHYTTRNVEDQNTRILVREVIDNSQITLETAQVAQLIFNGNFHYTYEPDYYTYQEEVDHILRRLKADYDNRVGKVDDNKVRTALLSWLDKRYRVTVRGSGGVYYLPTTPQSPSWPQISTEIIRVRDWLSQNSIGTLTAIELIESKQTTKPDFLETALNEVQEAMDLVEVKLREYTEKTGMNDGSRMEAAKSQNSKIEEITKKIDALEDALGDKLGPIKARAMLIGRRARNMHKAAQTAVNNYRFVRAEKKAKTK